MFGRANVPTSGTRQNARNSRLAALENSAKMAAVPAWALTACENAKRAGVLDTTANGSYDFYRMVTILDRAGIFKNLKEAK